MLFFRAQGLPGRIVAHSCFHREGNPLIGLVFAGILTLPMDLATSG
jgi:hypothetical protein